MEHVVLSVANTGATGVQLSFITKLATGGGTLYTVLTATNEKPSVAQIVAGEDASGSAGLGSDDVVPATADPTDNVSTIAGLTAAVTYYFWAVQVTDSGNSIVIGVPGTTT